jgi:electron transport complex protein RnfE
VVREVLGSGSLFGIDLFGPRFQDWVILVLPSGGFLTLASWLLFFNWLKQRNARIAAQEAAA